MRILAYGVREYERGPLEKAFAGRHPLHCLEAGLDADTAALAAGYEMVCTGVGAALSCEVMERLVRGGTRMVTQRSTGHNNVDLAAAERLGLWVWRVSCHAPHSVAEFAWGLVQTLNRGIHRAYARTREFDFRLDGLMGRDVRGMTVGVVGTGRIGSAFAAIAHGYGTALLGWDAAPDPGCRALGMTYVGLPDLLTRSDVVSLHVPLTPATYHLIDGAALELLREDAFLVNTSRGGLIATGALEETLRAGRPGGVALDVYEEEAGVFYRHLAAKGIADDALARLMTFRNVIVTSHQAFFTREAVQTVLDATARNVEDYLAGKVTENTLCHP
jgi:D-lactate dehydrogenase